MSTLTHVFLPVFVKIGEGEVTKIRRGITDRNPRIYHQNDSSKILQGHCFLTTVHLPNFVEIDPVSDVTYTRKRQSDRYINTLSAAMKPMGDDDLAYSGNALMSIKKVTLHRARLILGRVAVCERVNHLGMPPRSTQPGYPSLDRRND